MTGNKSYLSDYEEIDGGFVAFRGSTKRGKITRKDTECVVLSSDFKLLDESQVLLRVPRKNNMYSVDLKNVAPLGDHNLWDVIANGDLEEEPAPTGETSDPPAPKTAKQLAAKRNQERVKSILLLA
ncbi:hypothetical protein Tco_1520816, partial [Tanacetum coccineum]